MKKTLKNSITILIAVLVMVLFVPMKSNAGYLVTIRVPDGSYIWVNGHWLDPDAVTDYGYIDGRIQQIAFFNYHEALFYREYQVELNSMDDIYVFSPYYKLLTPSKNGKVIDYTLSSDSGLVDSVTDRVKSTAISFHNRVGGYGGADFTSYFQYGSDAYNKIVGSDAGRKWGQYVRAANITNVDVYEICRYTEDLFSARVDITAVGTYTESYSLFLLFEKINGVYYANYFTFQY